MKKLLAPLILASLTLPLLSAPTMAENVAPPPLTADQAQRVRCVAALAIVASEQERGVGDWGSLPPLRVRGGHFAETVGQSLTGEWGRTREAVRDAILAAVAEFQKGGDAALNPRVVVSCIELMDRIDPPPPPPELTECAALVSLAADQMRAKKGFDDTTRLMVTFATVLDSRARSKLRSEGRSEAENDVILGVKKEQFAAAAKQPEKNKDLVIPEMSACLELAKP
jgi:hypothetical protein